MLVPRDKLETLFLYRKFHINWLYWILNINYTDYTKYDWSTCARYQ